MAVKERVVQWYQDANMFALRCRECRFQFTLVRNIDKQYFPPESSRGTLDILSVRFIFRVAWPPHKSDNDLLGHQLRGQFQTLRNKLSAKEAHACDIAAGPVEACNKAKADGIARRIEYNWNSCRGGLG